MQARKQLTHSTAHTGKRQDQITKKNKGKNRREEKTMKVEDTDVVLETAFPMLG